MNYFTSQINKNSQRNTSTHNGFHVGSCSNFMLVETFNWYRRVLLLIANFIVLQEIHSCQYLYIWTLVLSSHTRKWFIILSHKISKRKYCLNAHLQGSYTNWVYLNTAFNMNSWTLSNIITSTTWNKKEKKNICAFYAKKQFKLTRQIR